MIRSNCQRLTLITLWLTQLFRSRYFRGDLIVKIYQVISYSNMQPYVVVANSPIEAIKTLAKQDNRLSSNLYDFDVSVIDADSFTEPTIVL